jgi:16S rRNA (adenine1518-N6/adenine1519-N6)-dimethyltransferase
MIYDAKKSLGQHWLHDKGTLDHLCDIALVHEHDTVLEVGPGKGTLTKQLLARGAHVVAVELDDRLYVELAANLASAHLTLVNEDILEFDLGMLPTDYKVVANIPYYLTSHLIRVLTEAKNPPKSITLLVQKEVAERLAAQPGNMSLLSVSAQFYYDVELGQVAAAKLFQPPPKVDSQVVHMLRKPAKAANSIDVPLLFRVVKAGFSSRRKTILNSLSAGLQLSKEATNKVLNNAAIPPQTRPQELSIEKWIKLAEVVNKLSG